MIRLVVAGKESLVKFIEGLKNDELTGTGCEKCVARESMLKYGPYIVAVAEFKDVSGILATMFFL